MAKTNAAKADTAPQDNSGEAFETLIAVSMLPLLAALAEATRSGETAFLYVDEGDAKTLYDAGLALVDTNTRNDDKQVAVRLNDAGLAYAEKNPAEPDNNVLSNQGNSDAKEASDKKRQSTGYVRPAVIELDKSVQMPSVSRGRAGETSYPFDTMEVGDSFHIAATNANKDPAKSVASSVSTANIKYSREKKDENGNVITKPRKVRNGEIKHFPEREPIKQFTIRSVDASDPKGVGCRVWRVK